MLDELPEDLCQVAVQKIGQAQFSKLSPEVSKMMREKDAAMALRCMVSYLEYRNLKTFNTHHNLFVVIFSPIYQNILAKLI